MRGPPKIEVHVYNGIPYARPFPCAGQKGRYWEALRDDPCAYCGGPGGTVDHITPRALGGGNRSMNLTGACETCNLSKDPGSGERPHLSILEVLLENC